MSKANNNLDLPTGQRGGKAFATLAAQFALIGFVLFKGESPFDGQALYYAMRLSTAQPLADLEDAARYLAVLLGAGDGGA